MTVCQYATTVYLINLKCYNLNDEAELVMHLYYVFIFYVIPTS